MAALPTSPNPMPAVRAARLLEAMHPVCSHDLPNQAVALQSFLQLFAWDELDKLSPQGRGYFERLQSIAGKTSAMAQFLKEMTRLQKQTVHLDRLSANQVLDEVRAEAQRLFPEQTWTWRAICQAEQVLTDRRLLHHGLLYLIRSAALRGAMASVEIETVSRADHAAWTITIRFAEPMATAKPPSEVIQIEQRLAMTLALEYLAAAEITCRPIEGAPDAATSFALEIPERAPHD